MRITIKYEASWRNSFLDGSNNESLPKAGRRFVGSMTNLKKAENFIERKVELNTVMGILNRLIGDQRKLYQARASDNYFFKDIESLIIFDDVGSKQTVNHEMTYIRNITGSNDQNSYTGMIKVNDPVFQSDYTTEFWGVLALDLPGLCDYIINNTPVSSVIDANPLTVIERLEELNKLKTLENTGEVQQAFQLLQKRFDKFKGVNNKGEVFSISLYCSALYLQLERLADKYDLSSAKTKAGGISGISNNSFTKKDFMSRYTTGDKKKIWGNPYIRKERIKGVGEITSLMKKVSGTLEIELPIDRAQAIELEGMIKDAGVSSFYMGKKGLAYVADIRI